MFTGIVQAIGKVQSIVPEGDALSMTVLAPGFFAKSKRGDSVANDGVCLTVETCTADSAVFCLVRQTVANTAFAERSAGSSVNLELPCSAGSLLGGHLVMGHVDSMAKVLKVTPRETGEEVDLEIPAELSKYVIRRGSVALNGISLTVAEKNGCDIRVALIPETIAKTNASGWKPGALVNVEVDMIGKYVENFMKEAHLAK